MLAAPARAQDAPEPTVSTVNAVADPGADRWSGRVEKLNLDQWVKRGQDASKKSDWLEAARCAGIAQVMLRNSSARVVSQYSGENLPKLIAKSATHLTGSQAACLEAWFGPTPEFWRAYGSAMVDTKRWDEARAQALAVLARFPATEAANGAEGTLQKAHVAAPQDVPAGATNSVFNLVLLSPHSGDYEAFGKSLRCGVEIAIAEYNARAALPIRLSEYETEGEGWRAASAGKRALDQGAGVLMGDVLTVPTFVLAGLANQSGVPLLSPSATDPMVGATGPLVFQTGAPLEAQARALARYAVKNDKRRVIAAPANVDSLFLNPFSAEVKQLGSSVVRVQGSSGMRDFHAVADELKRRAADAVLLPLDPEQAELWVAGLMKQGVFLPYLATDVLDPQGFHPETRRVLEGMVAVSTDYALPEQTFARVDSLARAAYGLDADRFVRRGYLTGQLITKTIAAGADSPASFAAAVRRRAGRLGFVHYDDAEASLPIMAVRRGQLVRVH